VGSHPPTHPDPPTCVRKIRCVQGRLEVQCAADNNKTSDGTEHASGWWALKNAYTYKLAYIPSHTLYLKRRQLNIIENCWNCAGTTNEMHN